MDKSLTFTILIIFIIYLIIGFFVKIPFWFDTTFYSIVAIGALYFFLFKLEGHKEIQSRLRQKFQGKEAPSKEISKEIPEDKN
ncbi:hypothetical protein C8D70_12317 [Chryseobacterium sp. CBTAP 102]|uniref:hypothetical protein n=1 Tax=Chryseobacterium sp. CBTAP 102 TaxID=2135644 RepID=UPI000D770AFE|nr:hypothetical protein [Chryseobacterium sp. CBTAP 102]PXW07102.1 hypothetical protein C8D70_12317 [Chryseobacterium sp. CBTAP 102]